jgi:UDP-glucuronate 4-epimerase
MAHYLVTGAAGFIAARTAELLLEDGHTVIGVDNLNDAYDPRMKEYRLKRLQALKGFTFHKLDVSDKSIIERFKNEKFDAVINLAARAGVRFSVDNPWVFVETNMIGTLNMLELCRHSGTKKFVVASTSSIYGEDPPYPTPEAASSSEPLQPYAASKKGAEAMCHAYHRRQHPPLFHRVWPGGQAGPCPSAICPMDQRRQTRARERRREPVTRLHLHR